MTSSLTPAPRVHTSSRLFYRDGSSDKEYHAAIHESGDGFTVIFAFGRRGSALQAGTKTSCPVALEKAQQIYDKLIAEKMAKGYTPDGAGIAFAMTDNENRVSGLNPQLLNPIDESAAPQYLTDNAWCLQEKFDGKRIMIAVVHGTVSGSNRKGLFVSLPQEISNSFAALPDCELDGELLGDLYVAFDLLKLRGDDLRVQPYRIRYQTLTGTIMNTGLVCVAESAWGALQKQALYTRIAQQGGEGVVFKRLDGRSAAGRPASGGSQVKCKFYATCTCFVASQNDQRSVRLQLFDMHGVATTVGNVTIPSNKAIPLPGTLVEIRYLYAYTGGSLYQPTYLGERDDLSPSDCRMEQLKYKSEGDFEAEEI